MLVVVPKQLPRQLPQMLLANVKEILTCISFLGNIYIYISQYITEDLYEH